MTIPLEIMLRGNNHVFTDTIVHPVDPANWTDQDVATILRHVLVAINRVQKGAEADEPEVSLRGLSWIVHPSEAGVVIALEIHTAAAVAGPVALSPARLDDLITRALKRDAAGSVVVH